MYAHAPHDSPAAHLTAVPVDADLRQEALHHTVPLYPLCIQALLTKRDLKPQHIQNIPLPHAETHLTSQVAPESVLGRTSTKSNDATAIHSSLTPVCLEMA